MSVGVKGVYVVPDEVLDELERPVEEKCRMKHDKQQMQDEQLKTCQFESDRLILLPSRTKKKHRGLLRYRLSRVRWENNACL